MELLWYQALTIMLDLLGFSFTKPVKLKATFSNLTYGERDGVDNGAGVAYLEDEDQIIQELGSDSLYFTFHNYDKLVPDLLAGARNFIFSSKNGPPVQDFIEELHVTTVNDQVGLDTRLVCASNGTASKRNEAFYHVLGQMEKKGVSTFSPDLFPWLEDLLSKACRKERLNLLMADLNYLYVFSDTEGFNALSYVHKKAPFLDICFFDHIKRDPTAENMRLSLKAPLHGEGECVRVFAESAEDQEGFMIATVGGKTGAPNDEDWRAFPKGALTVFERGRCVYGKGRL